MQNCSREFSVEMLNICSNLIILEGTVSAFKVQAWSNECCGALTKTHIVKCLKKMPILYGGRAETISKHSQ